MAERKAAVIDGPNFYHGQLLAGWFPDMAKFDHLLGADQVTYFTVAPIYQGAQTRFYHFLEAQLQWTVRQFPLRRRTTYCEECGQPHIAYVEKSLDVCAAMELMKLGIHDHVDHLLLVTGDRDFLEPVRFLREKGVRVDVVSWRAGLSSDLAAVSSSPVLLIDEHKERLLRGKSAPLKWNLSERYDAAAVAGGNHGR